MSPEIPDGDACLWLHPVALAEWLLLADPCIPLQDDLPGRWIMLPIDIHLILVRLVAHGGVDDAVRGLPRPAIAHLAHLTGPGLG